MKQKFLLQILGSSGSAAAFIRKRGHKSLNEWRRICLEIQNITFGRSSSTPKPTMIF